MSNSLHVGRQACGLVYCASLPSLPAGARPVLIWSFRLAGGASMPRMPARVCSICAYQLVLVDKLARHDAVLSVLAIFCLVMVQAILCC